MRHLFDQYNQPENRLTHALVASLGAEPALLRRFIQWATGERTPGVKLGIVEQTCPGEPEPRDEDEASHRGLPDGWIYDGNGWALIIESKIESPLNRDQLERHHRTAMKRGFTSIHLLALVADLPTRGNLDGLPITVKKWSELYCWLLRQRESEWARRLSSYMEVLEQKLVRDDYLRGGTLTVFAGIPFGKDEPYTYLEAKRLLRLAMDVLRKRTDLQRELGMDPEGERRSAITGRDSIRIWDYLRLLAARGARHTEFPHLTFSIQQEQLHAQVTIPHQIRPEFRRNLLVGGREGFCELFTEVLTNFNDTLGGVEGAVPWVEMVQRRYPYRRAEPFVDARLQFDLRTGFDGATPWTSEVKRQPQWIEAAYDSLSHKNSNLQIGVGGIFRYERCPATRKPEILDHVADVWLACKPLIARLLGSH